MRVRRCAMLMLEPRERLEFELGLIADGGSGLRTVIEWVAHAPHLAGETLVSAAESAALGALSPSDWTRPDAIAARCDPNILDSLIGKGLVVAEGTPADARDRAFRDAHWRAASAVMHYASRWQGVDTDASERRLAELADRTLIERLGAAPAAVRERVAAADRRRLPKATPTPLDGLLDARVTCRNYDATRNLSEAHFASVLYRAYGARAIDDFAPGIQLLKKGVPSAGGLHATEAYLLVQRVEGVAPGLYHYHPTAHALEPVRQVDAAEAAALARRFVASQRYFVDAHVLVIAVGRFRRNFWKYRNHAKAYRALILDVGHLSQALYLAATELGLAAFITAAINEADIEHAFGLDPLEEGALAVSGFGHRAAERSEVEFDPLRAVWKGA